MSGQKPPANRMMQMQFKAKVAGAKKGHGLLKKKRDALKMRLLAMLHEIIECKREVQQMVDKCALSLAKSEFVVEGNLVGAVLSKVGKEPDVKADLLTENVAGCKLPVFQVNKSGNNNMDTLMIGCGGQAVQSAREVHQEAVITLIKMASLQTSFTTLDEEIKMTSRRVNALECVVIPKLQEICEWIKQEMDEMEREEFFRVKKVVEKKKVRMAKELQEMKELSKVKKENDKQQGGASPKRALGGFTRQTGEDDLMF